MKINRSLPLSNNSASTVPFVTATSFLQSLQINNFRQNNELSCRTRRRICRRKTGSTICGLLPVDPWSPTIDSQSIASQLFAVSLFPYIGFLYFITKSKSAPKLTLFGFYFLLAFVGATSEFTFHLHVSVQSSQFCQISVVLAIIRLGLLYMLYFLLHIYLWLCLHDIDYQVFCWVQDVCHFVQLHVETCYHWTGLKGLLNLEKYFGKSSNAL